MPVLTQNAASTASLYDPLTTARVAGSSESTYDRDSRTRRTIYDGKAHRQ